MVDLDLRKIRYFVAVAECASFRGASERLLVAQPALSRQVRSLEHELGVRLLDRTPRGVELTRAGHTVLAESRGLLRSAATLSERARRTASASAQVTVAFRSGVGITAAVRAFRRLRPHVNVDVLCTSAHDQTSALLDGRADLGFVRAPYASAHLHVVPLYSEPNVVAMAGDHPLVSGAAGGIRLADLVPFRTTPPSAGPGRPARTAPDPGVLDDLGVDSVEGQLERVAAGRWVLVLPASVARSHARGDVVYVRARDAPPSTVALAFGSRAADCYQADFVRVAQACLGPARQADATPASVGAATALDPAAAGTGR